MGIATTENNRIRLFDQVDQGLVTVDDANVQMVLNERFRLVGKMPRTVRTALNAAVKAGTLGHLKKDGLKPEAYFHPTFEYLAVAARNEKARAGVEAMLKICI